MAKGAEVAPNSSLITRLICLSCPVEKINFEIVFFIGKRIKFAYSEKATKFCEISTLLLSTVYTDKSKVEILQNFVAFSEYMNFTV